MQTGADLDRDLTTLAGSKESWGRLGLSRRIQLLHGVRQAVYEAAPAWVAAAVQGKGLQPGSPLAGEEWISGPWAVLYAINRYLRTLSGLQRTGRVPLPAMRRGSDGRTILEVFPYDGYDRLLLGGVRAHVWMQPGVTPDMVRSTAARLYRDGARRAPLALILGAGNIASIPVLDVLYKIVAEGAPCMLKMNPVNDYLGPVLERALQPLTDAGLLRFAFGGADVGAHLCAHALVDEIHVTGSEQTHNAISRGPGAGKPMTSELGNVSPTIVLPGNWNEGDVRFQAEHIATQKAHNAGFNCIATQVLILPQQWPHTPKLLDQIAGVFARMEQRPEYYPGAPSRRTALAGGSSPLRSIVRIDARHASHPAFCSEAFCGVLAIVELPGDLEQFARSAVAFANNALHGTLGANVVANPRTMREHRSVLDRTIADLRYGCVGVNAWTGVGYFITETPWGAYPGHTIDDPGSGTGVVHNSYLLERSEKSVVWAPFRQFPKPVWFVTNCAAADVGRALCDFEVARNPVSALRVAASALRG